MVEAVCGGGLLLPPLSLAVNFGRVGWLVGLLDSVLTRPVRGGGMRWGDGNIAAGNFVGNQDKAATEKHCLFV